VNARRLSITCLSDAELLSRHDLPSAVLLAAAQYCTDRRAVYIVDPPARWEQLVSEGRIGEIDPEDLGIYGQKPVSRSPATLLSISLTMSLKIPFATTSPPPSVLAAWLPPSLLHRIPPVASGKPPQTLTLVSSEPMFVLETWCCGVCN
jgi:hypothetical protein